MKRVWFSFFLAPLLISAGFGTFFLFAYPFMLAITLIFAVPLFFILKKFHWLQWWHALLAGTFCGLCFISIDMFFSAGTDIDWLISGNNLFYVGLGALVGTIFWWMGLFKNPCFPFISSKFPLSFLLVIPLAIMGVKAHQALDMKFNKGRVTSILVEPSINPRHGQGLVRLENGVTVQADISNTWPSSTMLGTCVDLLNRFSTLRMQFIYEISSPVGGNVNEC